MRVFPCVGWIAMVVAAFAPAAGAAPSAPAGGGFSIGVNLDSNTDYSTDACWANVFHRFSGSGNEKTNRGWGKPEKPWDPDANLELTPDGYPLADAACFTYGRGYPNGVYKFRMAGSGTPSFSGKGRIVANTLKTAGGFTTADVEIAANRGSMIMFKLTGIDPSNPPLDLRLIVPGLAVETDQVYATWFLEKLKPFTTIREMDRGRTNHSELTNWEDRVRPEQFCQTSLKGVAYEYMIDLANESGKDLWICVPDQATDDYVDQMAALFAKRLNSKCFLYVEYSNEWWNPGFKQHIRGRETSKTNEELTSSDPSERLCQQSAFNAVRVSRAFKKAFGDRVNQVRPVMGLHAAVPWWGEMELKFIAKKYGSVSNELYAIAGTGYYGLWEGDKDNPGGGVDKEGMTLDDYFADLGRSIEKVRDKTIKHRKLAEQYGIKLLAYEGGLHVTDRNGMLRKDINSEVKKQAVTDPRMGKLITGIFDAWRRDVGDDTLFMYFNFCSPGGKFGRWGLLEQIDQDGSLKYDAAVEYQKEHGTYTPSNAAAAAKGRKPAVAKTNAKRYIGAKEKPISSRRK